MFNHKNIDFNNIKPLACKVLDNVSIAPMIGALGNAKVCAFGAYTEKKAIVEAQYLFPQGYGLEQHVLPYTKPVCIIDKDVIYGGVFYTQWGHFLLETLQRLWYTKNKSFPIVWTGVWGEVRDAAHFKAWQSEVFKVLNIHNEHIFLTENTQFRRVHFPEPGFGIHTHAHPEHMEFLSSYENSVIQRRYVYLSRAKFNGCANESSIESLLKSRGWKIVYPEELSVEEQLRAIGSAHVCFMISGSAQHSLVLAKNLKTRFVVFPRLHGTPFNLIANFKSDDYFLFHLKQETIHYDASLPQHAHFMLNADILKNVLEQTNDFTENLDNFPEYFQKPEQLRHEHVAVPELYTRPLPTSKAQRAYYRALSLYEAQKYTQAYKVLEYLKKHDALEESMYETYFKAKHHYQIASHACTTGFAEKATWAIRNILHKIELGTASFSEYLALAEVYLSISDVYAAIETLKQLTYKAPTWALPHMFLAQIYENTNNREASLQCIARVIELEPWNLQHALKIAMLHRSARNYLESNKILTTAQKQHPRHASVKIALAELYYAQGRLDLAITILKEALMLDSSMLIIYTMLADYLYEKNGTNVEEEMLAQYAKHNVPTCEYYEKRAHCVAAKGDIERAIEYISQAIFMRSEVFSLQEQLAQYLAKKHDYESIISIMLKAIHNNPFLETPYLYLAHICLRMGHAKEAAQWARKASSIAPLSIRARQEVEYYRMQTFFFDMPQHEKERLLITRKSSTVTRVQRYIDMLSAETYLEIGVFEGGTFLNMDVPFKMAVDPDFRFETALFTNEATLFYKETSDCFFDNLPQYEKIHHAQHGRIPLTFDVIFLDGLHTFEQTLRDFENSLRYSHEKTIWIIDDTVPSHVFSAMHDVEMRDAWKACAGLEHDMSWHGDVFKTIFAIHDDYPEFSYCTQVNNGNPQTILWRTDKATERKKIADTLKKRIEHIRYEDFMEYAWVMYPVDDEAVYGKIYTQIDPLKHRTGYEYKEIIRPLITDKERMLAAENYSLAQCLEELKANQKKSEDEIRLLKCEILKLLQKPKIFI